MKVTRAAFTKLIHLSLSLSLFLDHGEVMEMPGLGGSPSSWQQAENASHASSCLSCSAGGGSLSVELPGACNCMHDR